MRASYLSKRETAGLLDKILTYRWGKVLEGRKPRQALEVRGDDVKVYRIGGLLVAEIGGLIFPTLVEKYNSEALSLLPSLIVDMGAIPYISRGADVMRPGVRGFEGEMREGELLVVRDERHGKAIAIARALVDGEELASMERGKVAENIHHIGDKIWRLIEKGRKILEQS